MQESGNTQEVIGDANILGATRRVEISLVENTVGASFIYGLQVGYIGVDMENNTEIREAPQCLLLGPNNDLRVRLRSGLRSCHYRFDKLCAP